MTTFKPKTLRATKSNISPVSRIRPISRSSHTPTSHGFWLMYSQWAAWPRRVSSPPLYVTRLATLAGSTRPGALHLSITRLPLHPPPWTGDPERSSNTNDTNLLAWSQACYRKELPRCMMEPGTLHTIWPEQWDASVWSCLDHTPRPPTLGCISLHLCLTLRARFSCRREAADAHNQSHGLETQSLGKARTKIYTWWRQTTNPSLGSRCTGRRQRFQRQSQKQQQTFFVRQLASKPKYSLSLSLLRAAFLCD